MELISIIVPVYKVEPYLDRCVQSIVNQTYRNLEIILVDDGSPDHCPAMCDAWAEKDDRIRVIHKKNGGLSDARNAGIDTAEGDLLGFVDSDDWLHPSFYEILYAAMTESGAELAGCNFQKVSEEEAYTPQVIQNASIRCYSNEEALKALTCDQAFRAVAWNKLYRRSLFDTIRYPQGRFHEDEFVTYRILNEAHGLVYVDEQMYYYLQRSASIMSTITPKHLDVLDAYASRLALFQEKYPRLFENDLMIVCKTCVTMYRQALQSDRENLAVYREKISECMNLPYFKGDCIKHFALKEKVFVYGAKYCLHLLASVLNIRR